MTRVADLGVPTSPNGKDVSVPQSRADWRRWLASNPDRSDGLWVVYRKKSSDLGGPVYDDLVEEALCFGWIDSKVRRIDDDRVVQWFSPRRAGGLRSALNKDRIERGPTSISPRTASLCRSREPGPSVRPSCLVAWVSSRRPPIGCTSRSSSPCLQRPAPTAPPRCPAPQPTSLRQMSDTPHADPPPGAERRHRARPTRKPEHC